MLNSVYLLFFLPAYVVFHFLIYAVRLRKTTLFLQESAMIRYHLFSAVFLGVVCFIFPLNSFSSKAALSVLAIAFHGIYSISFLSFWSSADGGFSLRILYEFFINGAAGPVKIQNFYDLADAKKEDRLESLIEAGLVCKQNGSFGLTLQGRRIAGAILAIARFCRIKEVL